MSVEIGAVCTKDTKIYVHNTTDYPKQQLTTEVPGASVGLTATWRTDVDTVYCTVSIFLKSVQSIQTVLVLRYRVLQSSSQESIFGFRIPSMREVAQHLFSKENPANLVTEQSELWRT